MTKEEIIAAIQECAAKLGHVPSFPELERTMNLGKRALNRHFSNYREALSACGLERTGAGYKHDTGLLLLDWAGTVRRLGKIPTMVDYTLHGKYSVSPMLRRFSGWSNVPTAMLAHAKKEGLERDWEDVLDVIAKHLDVTAGEGRLTRPANGTLSRPRRLADQPTYGTPLLPLPLSHAPTNEMGVVFLFGALARELGYMVTRLQTEFPDGEVMREIEPGKWQRARIEFEHESRNFLAHMHPVSGCDLIVCWRHNWENCPLEVLELSKEIDRIAGIGKIAGI